VRGTLDQVADALERTMLRLAEHIEAV